MWTSITVGFALSGYALFLFAGFRPVGRGTFSCLPKRKYPKRRAPGALIGSRRCPAFLDNQGVRRTRYAQTTAPLIPDCLRYSVSADGSGVVGSGFGFIVLTLVPSGAAEHRSEARMTLAPCLSVASCASVGLREKHREPA